MENNEIMGNEIVSFEKNKNKSKVLLSLLSIIILIIVSTVIIYFYINSNPLLAIKYNTNKLTKNLTEQIEQQEKIKKVSGNLQIDYNIESNDNNLKEFFKDFNGIKLVANYKIDKEQKIMQTELKTTYKNEKLIDTNIYMQDEKSFILLPDAFDKYITIDLSKEYNNIFNTSENNEEIKVIIKSVNQAFQKSIKKEYLTSEDKTITIDDKKTKTTKISMKLDEKKLTKITKEFLVYLKEDKEFIKSAVTISKNKNIKEELKNLIDTISYDNNTDITLSIYCKGIIKEVVRYEAELKLNEEKYNISITKHKDKYNFNIKQEDLIIAKGTITKDKDNDKEKTLLETSIMELGTLTINIINQEEKNPIINKKEIKESINYEELTEKQIEEIKTNISKNRGFEKLSTVFSSLITQSY